VELLDEVVGRGAEIADAAGAGERGDVQEDAAGAAGLLLARVHGS
jgi:hypothetical protein